MPASAPYQRWAASHGPEGIHELDDFFRGVAEARYVIRRVVRIVDEQARGEGLDPLEHQLLLQLLGAAAPMAVGALAERLDVPAAVASRLAKQLEQHGMVVRGKAERDRRVTDVEITAAGREVCVRVWEDVRVHIEAFQSGLGEEARWLALGVFGFTVGLASATPVPEP